MESSEPLWLRPAEVAELYAEAKLPVPDDQQLRAAAAAGRLTSTRTLGDHHRYSTACVRRLIARALKEIDRAQEQVSV